MMSPQDLANARLSVWEWQVYVAPAVVRAVNLCERLLAHIEAQENEMRAAEAAIHNLTQMSERASDA